MSLKLEVGKAYESKSGDKWLCYEINMSNDTHCQARCIRTGGGDRVEYFYLDGRYDESGLREHTLIKEVLIPGQEWISKLQSNTSEPELSESSLCEREGGILVVHNLEVLKAVHKERIRQERLKLEGKFTFTCADDGESYSEKCAILLEEVGEVAREVVEHTITARKYASESNTQFGFTNDMPPHRQAYFRDRIHKELVQVAAVAVAWCESLSREFPT